MGHHENLRKEEEVTDGKCAPYIQGMDVEAGFPCCARAPLATLFDPLSFRAAGGASPGWASVGVGRQETASK